MMEDEGRVRWVWVTDDGRWGEIERLWLVDADDGLVEVFDTLTIQEQQEGILNIAQTMGAPAASLLPEAPRMSDRG